MIMMATPFFLIVGQSASPWNRGVHHRGWWIPPGGAPQAGKEDGPYCLRNDTYSQSDFEGVSYSN